MIHSQKNSNLFSLVFALLLACTVALSGCTSSQEASPIDDEMMAESGGGTSDGSDESIDEPSVDDTTTADHAATDKGGAEDEMELDFEDFEKNDANQQNAQNDAADENDLEKELNLDDLQAEDVVQTPEPPPLEPEKTVETAPILEEAPTAPQAEADPFTEPAEKTAITDIRYLSNQAGGTVVIEASGKLQHQSRFNPQNGQYVVEVENATLPDKLKRPYLMKDFSGAIGSVNAYQVPGESTVRVVVQLKPGVTTEPTLQEEGNSIVVVPPSAPLITAQQSTAPGQILEVSSKPVPLGAQSLEALLMNNQKFYGKPISIQVRDADIRDVIGFVAEESGANIVIADNITGKISVKLRQIPWDQALVSIMKTKGLGYVRQGNVIRISTMKDLREETEAAQALLNAQKDLAPVKVKVIPVNYAMVDVLEKQVANFLSKEGKVVADVKSNSILVTDKEDVLEKVTRLVQALDKQPEQVLIEGKIVEAVENFISQIGVNWSANGSAVTLNPSGGVNGTPLQLTPNLRVGETTSTLANVFGFRLGRLDFLGDLNAALRLAETENAAKVISSPRIVAMNKERAEIAQVGEQISIVSTRDPQTNETSKTEKRTKINLRLTVIPQITSDGSVIMDMDVIREFAGPEVDQDTKARPINTRTAKSKVLVRNGQTAVIGGIYQVDEVQTEEGVPVLKDIPVLGWLFKTKTKSRDKNELLIFLTPRIMLENNEQTSASL